MSLDTAASLKVILDTNIIVSAIGYGGKPSNILLLAFEGKIQAITSSVLLVELQGVLIKKLLLPLEDLELTIEEIKDKFKLVRPRKILHVVKDEDDNRVLEAAVEGGCNFIITGDKELLKLGKFKNIQILTADAFLGKLSAS